MLLVIVVLQPIAKAFAELDALSAYFLLFLFVELVTFAQIADIRASFLDVAISQSLVIQVFKISQLIGNDSIL